MNWTVASKLKAGFGLVLALFLLLAGLTAWQLEAASAATQRMERSAELLRLASAWQGHVRQNSARSLAVGFSEGGAMLGFFKEAMAATSAQTSETQKEFLALVQSEASRKRADDVVEVRKRWLAVRDESNQMKASGNDAAARTMVQDKFVPLTEEYVRVTQALVDGEQSHVQQAQKQVEESFKRLYGVGAILLVLGVVLAVLISRSLSRSIAGGLARASRAAERIGQGDLSGELDVRGNDEIARLFAALAAMQKSLVQVVSTVRQGSESVSTASAEIASGNNDLSARTEQQASALEQTAASMEELGATVRHNADNARQANQMAQNASSVALQGGEVVGRVVATMKEINDSSRKISDIIGVIDGIAFQTNILALNAAVEAARAGEQGRGFAVVAGEVRSLAQRSAEAAREIKSLIGVSVERVEQGSALVDQAGSTMNEVVAAIRRVSDIVGEISAASTEQSDGVAQVGEAVVQMDRSTQQNAALVEESAAAAESLKNQAQELVKAVSVFRLDGRSA